jgi:hypothetical protein
LRRCRGGLGGDCVRRLAGEPKRDVDIYFSNLPRASAWTANVKVSDDPGTAIQRLPRIAVDATGNLTAVRLEDRTSPAKLRMNRLPSGTST